MEYTVTTEQIPLHHFTSLIYLPCSTSWVFIFSEFTFVSVELTWMHCTTSFSYSSLHLQSSQFNSSVVNVGISRLCQKKSHPSSECICLFNPFSLFVVSLACLSVIGSVCWFDINSWVNIGITVETVETQACQPILLIWALNPSDLSEIWVCCLHSLSLKLPRHTAAKMLSTLTQSQYN